MSTCPTAISGITGLFKAHVGYEITASADYFQDKVDKVRKKLGDDSSRRYTGLNEYKKKIEGDFDAIAMQLPLCFHPEQIATAVCGWFRRL